jgi:hypothetical protein
MASGFSVGAVQQTATNLIEGNAWYEGVTQSAIVGAIGGAVAGGVVGAMNPQSLPAKMLVGGMVGGGVSAGTRATPQELLSVQRGRRAALERGCGDGVRDGVRQRGHRCLHRPLWGHGGGAGDDATARARRGGRMGVCISGGVSGIPAGATSVWTESAGRPEHHLLTRTCLGRARTV